MKQNFIAEAISEHWGDRCPDFNDKCACCQAWAQYDHLSAGQAQPVASEAAQTLLDRLDEFRVNIDDIDDERSFEGHVVPAMAGLRSALVTPTAWEVERLRKALETVRANLVRLAWEENTLMIEGIDAALASPAVPGEVERMQDKIEGLEADLENAVKVAFKRGATEWTRLNYPDRYATLSATVPLPEIDKGEGWQPIETAPIDGTDILVCVTYNLFDDEWETMQWVDWQVPAIVWPVFRDRIDIPFPPTHWMPLPAAPSASIEGETK